MAAVGGAAALAAVAHCSQWASLEVSPADLDSNTAHPSSQANVPDGARTLGDLPKADKLVFGRQVR